MGISSALGQIATGIGKQVMVDKAFRRGQMGEPPLISASGNPELQALYDRAYEQGRQSLVNKATGLLSKKLDE